MGERRNRLGMSYDMIDMNRVSCMQLVKLLSAILNRSLEFPSKVRRGRK